MEYELIIEEKRDYIRCVISGVRRQGKILEQITPIWSQVVTLCKEKEIFKILAIFKLMGQITVLDSVDVVTNSENFNWDKRFALALVETNIDSRKGNLFTETYAVNRGYRMKVFENEESALKWLSVL